MSEGGKNDYPAHSELIEGYVAGNRKGEPTLTPQAIDTNTRNNMDALCVPTSSKAAEPEVLATVSAQAVETLDDCAGTAYPSMPLEERFFGFHPCKLVEQVEDCVRDLLEDALDGLETSLFRECALAFDALQENAVTSEHEHAKRLLLQQGLMRLRDALFTAFYDQMDRLQVYLLRNVFHIPPGLRIPNVNTSEDLVENWEQALGIDPSSVQIDANAEDEHAVDQELVALRQSLRVARQRLQRLCRERSVLEGAFHRLEGALQSRLASTLIPTEPEDPSGDCDALAKQVVTIARAVSELEAVVRSCRDQFLGDRSSAASGGAPPSGTVPAAAGGSDVGAQGALVRPPLELERIFDAHTKATRVDSLDAVDALRRALHRSC